MPESPRWLLSKGQDDVARKVLKRIRPENYNIDGEIADIKDAINKDANVGSFIQVLKGVASHQPTRRALIIGCSLQLFQQITGINTIMYYSATGISVFFILR